MARKVYVTLTVKAIILADDDANVQEIIDELDYNFSDTTGKAEVLDTTLEESEITDSKLKEYDKATGPCPYCGRKEHWYNDVPLRAFCWGTEKKPHREWHKKVPGKLQPYKEA